ncbi:hypothetical protein BVRB_5g115540 [Beta vulgaris subsp. vulgaris]|nr:hypothetical protein BVRB_5g115540 [Beta vulgaris subsp. vulgaris]
MARDSLVYISARNSKCLMCTIRLMEGPYCGLVEEAPKTLRIRESELETQTSWIESDLQPNRRLGINISNH